MVRSRREVVIKFTQNHLPHSTAPLHLSQDHARAMGRRHLDHHKGRATLRIIASRAMRTVPVITWENTWEDT